MDSLTYYKKALALLHERQFEPAAAALVAAVKQRKIFPEAYKALCVAYKELGDLNKAGQCAQLAAESFILQNKLKEAAALYVSSKKHNLELENPFEKLGKVSLKQGKTDRGAKLLSLASKCQPKDKRLVCEAALAWKASGNPEQAIKILENALEQGPFATGAMLYEQLTGHLWESSPEVNDLDKELEICLPPSLEAGDAPAAVPEQETPQQDNAGQTTHEDPREKRRSRRFPLFGYYVRIGKDKEEYEVLNLSATGIAFTAPCHQLSKGLELKLDLYGMEGLLCKKIAATVRHVTDGAAGCSFGKLNKKQQAVVHSLIDPHPKDDFIVDTDSPLDLGGW